jgi:hypothetical protein
MVAAAVGGLTMNTGVVQNFAVAVFIKPVAADLGISRAELSSRLVFALLLGLCIAHLFGKAIDYSGSASCTSRSSPPSP